MGSTATETTSIVRIAMLCEGGLLAVAVVLGWFLARPPLAQIDWTARAIVYGLAATLPLVAGLIAITWHPVGPFKTLEEVSRQLIVPLFADCAWWQLLAISAMAGIGEEALFRGVVQAGIKQWSGSSWWALAAASVLFGLAHLITPTYAVLAGLIGAYLGWLWLATDNLLVPIVTHGAYDFVALVYLLSRKRVASDLDRLDALPEDDFGVV
jgi:hypothetical protein